MSSKILFKKEARKAIKAGFDKTVDLVEITMGPRGGNVMIDPGYGLPIIANDAKTIVDAINLDDKAENMGVSTCKDIISKMEDGRSSALSIGKKLLNDGLKYVNNGVDPMSMRGGIEAAARDAIEILDHMSNKTITDGEIRQVATISSESEEIGNIVGDTIKKIGLDGVVTVEPSNTFGVESEIVDGIEIDRGYLSPYMITDIERMEAVAVDVPILITDKVVSNAQEILPVMKSVAAQGKSQMVIIAEDITGDALNMMILSKIRGGLSVLGIKAPGYGDKKKEILGDMAVMVGTNVVSDSIGAKLEDIGINQLGSARRIISTKEKTTIVDGGGDKKLISERVKQLKTQKDSLTNSYDVEVLEGRIANLVGGIAVIKVGAATETEMKYLKLKIEDAVKATKGAIKYGVVPGGGIALLRVKKQLDQARLIGESVEHKIGYKIMVDALEAPLRRILINAGYKEYKNIFSKFIANIKQYLFGVDSKSVDDILGEIYYWNHGYNARTNKLVDNMFDEGIIDGLQVTQNVVRYPSSAVGIFLTNGGTCVNEKSE